MASVMDTIFAPATPPGKSGVAVIRISGAQAGAITQNLTRRLLPPPRTAALRTLYAPDQSIIDDAIIIYFQAPQSFTGEDIVELQVHGSRAVMKSLISTLADLPGCRLAEPGEFARRALWNGKLDLLQAEALADLIEAETESQRRQASRIREGHAGAQFNAMRARIVHALAYLEAYIDFPDEELPEHVRQEVKDTVYSLTETIVNILNDGRAGERIREGITIVILGAPNAGKSSLLNVLAKRDIAIVSPMAGTTRDMIELHLDIGGYAAVIIDTAGLRETENAIEQEGIRRAMARAQHADITLLMFDASQFPHMDEATLACLNESALCIASKCDIAAQPLPGTIQHLPLIPLSTVSPEGLSPLLSFLNERIQTLATPSSEPLITHQRHRQALNTALTSLYAFGRISDIELACEELRIAAHAIGSITGTIMVDELLDEIFRNFCIGK